MFWPALEKNTNSIWGSNMAKYASKARFSQESGPGDLYREHESMQMKQNITQESSRNWQPELSDSLDEFPTAIYIYMFKV